MAYNPQAHATSSSSTGFGHGHHGQQKSGKTTAQMLSGISAVMAHNGSGEALNRTIENMREVLAKETSLSAFKLVAVDGQANGLNVSSILLHTKNPHDNSHVVYTYLLGASVGVLRPEVVKLPEGQFEIPTVISDLYGPTLREANFGVLARELGLGDNAEVVDAGGNGIPRSMAYDDVVSLRTILYYGVYAIHSIISDDMEDPVVYDLTEKDPSVYMHGEMDFRPGEHQNGVGNPVRRDVTINVTSVDGQNVHENGDQTYANSQVISSLSAYFDVVFTGKKPAMQQYQGGPIIEPSQIATARCTITDTTTLAGVTPELQMLSLASATTLSKGQYTQAWVNTFNPAVGNGARAQDIAALALELGMVIDTAAPDWRPMEFCREYVDDCLVYVLHVEDIGDLSWMHKMLLAAAENNGSKSRVEARNYIHAACDNLVGGNLSNFVDPNAPVCWLENDRIFLGHWIDGNGQKRDLREVDYLYALKHFGAHEMDLVIEFGTTFVPDSGPLEYRLGRRKQLYEAMLGGTVVIEGKATPVILDPVFWTGVQEAIASVGGEPKFEQHLYGEHVQQRDYHQLRTYSMQPISRAPTAHGYAYHAQPAFYDPRFNQR